MIRLALTAAAAVATIALSGSALGSNMKGTIMHPTERGADVKDAAMRAINAEDRCEACDAPAVGSNGGVQLCNAHLCATAGNLAHPDRDAVLATLAGGDSSARVLTNDHAHRAARLAIIRAAEHAGIVIPVEDVLSIARAAVADSAGWRNPTDGMTEREHAAGLPAYRVDWEAPHEGQ